MKRKEIKRIIFAVLICFFVLLVFSRLHIVVGQKIMDEPIGVIDGQRSYVYANEIYNGVVSSDLKEKTHGDRVLECINIYSKEAQVYYYNASGEDNVISTEEIMDGLEWMLENDIRKVNISLSSKNYSKEMEEWISLHRNQIQVYASYNNLKNSFDYPAMYSHVIGSGSENIEYKEGDKKYRGNVVVFLPKMKVYSGNSFLSLITMLESE